MNLSQTHTYFKQYNFDDNFIGHIICKIAHNELYAFCCGFHTARDYYFGKQYGEIKHPSQYVGYDNHFDLT